MHQIVCPLCHHALGLAERSKAELDADYIDSIRHRLAMNEHNRAVTMAIVQEHKRRHDLLQAHYKAEHPHDARFP